MSTHVEGTLRGEKIRKALDLTSWEAAQERVRDWELGVTDEQPITIADANKTYLDDAGARHLSRESLKKYRGLLKQLEQFAEDKGHRYLKQLDLAALREFRNRWRDGSISAKKRLERLRSFFRFAVQSGWLRQNLVASMRPPKTTHPPTMPFSKDEMDKILWACDPYPDNGRYRKGTPARLKALVLLMRYSGLRIGDAVTLRTDRVVAGKLFLYTQKTNVPVFCPLPHCVLDALDAVQPVTERHYG
jgi:integrase/recombinase XerD